MSGTVSPVLSTNKMDPNRSNMNARVNLTIKNNLLADERIFDTLPYLKYILPVDIRLRRVIWKYGESLS